MWPPPELLGLEERRRLLAVARGAIHGFVVEGRLPESPRLAEAGGRCGAFVTLHAAGRLRGCIGKPESPYPLETTVAHCAVLAASRDPRFPPVAVQELALLEIEISVLSPPETIPSEEAALRLVPGVHGAILSQSGRRGLLLPQVAIEHGFDAQRFLEEVCRKAGLTRQAWSDPETRIELFTAVVFSESELEPRAAPSSK
jgi:AmmeMemoRadiSam system protein A